MLTFSFNHEYILVAIGGDNWVITSNFINDYQPYLLVAIFNNWWTLSLAYSAHSGESATIVRV